MMNRDYKPSPERSKNTSKGNPLFTGLLIGILMGVAASLGVVMFIKGGESPFAQQTSNEITKSVSEKMQDQAIADQANADAATDLAPHTIANYLKELASELHSYYNEYKFLIEDEAVKIARLSLIAATQQVLKNGLYLLGVSAPEKM